MPACVVQGCTPKSREGEPDVIMHTFPKDKEAIKKWLIATGQDYPDLEQEVDKIFQSKTSTYRMCSMHFTTDCYYFNPSNGKKTLSVFAVPSVFKVKATTDVVVEGDISLPGMKRKRIESMPSSSTHIQPGEMCPTCRHVVPLRSSNVERNLKRSSLQSTCEKSTVFDKLWGTTSRGVQATVRTFSIKLQCGSLVERRKVRARRTRLQATSD
ncbi:DNA oxidative demethylase ALKBH2 isoform X5 [Hyla sarda]|uniref:DNA oxidative demethylase ALKBH2 isoform X5 n=1 Tax=Hyla sarda TaxID=327740 RepID=UPI0024C3843B|nr:DNA oxidative demethylase ALKBH2 isoform X5 [Hyla sarda]